MTRRTLAFFALVCLAAACAVEENPVTEIGNPKTNGKGAASALGDHVTGLVAAVAASPSAEGLALPFPGNQVVSGCSWDQTNKRISCSCARVGTVETTYDSEFTSGSSVLVFDAALATVFDICAFESCGEITVVDGELAGRISGTFDTSSGTGEVVVDYAGEGACDELYFDGSGVGVDFAVTYDGMSVEAAGTVCLNGGDVTFASLADLDAQLDPEGTCE